MSHALDPDLLARLAPDLRAAVEAQLRQALTAEAELRQHLEAENADLRARNDRLEHLVREFQRARFGPRSEKLHPDQMELAVEDIEVAIATATEEHDAAAQARTGKRPPRQPRGPRTLPKELPREEQVIAPEDLTWSPSGAPSVRATMATRLRADGADRRGSLGAAGRHPGPVPGDRDDPSALRLPRGAQRRRAGQGPAGADRGRAADRGAARPYRRVEVLRASAALPPVPGDGAARDRH